MMARVLWITSWVALGHAISAGLFWALVNIPESSVPMLALSAVTGALALLVAGLTETTALAAAGRAGGWRESLAAGVRRWPAFLLGLALFLAFWWLSGRGFAWHQAHRGEIDAWLLVNFKWSRTAWLHAGATGLLTFVRFPLAGAVALGAMAAIVLNGRGACLRLRWVRLSLGWRSLAAALIVFVACLWGPWYVVYWRPRSLPPTWMEPVFVGPKLLLLYAWAHAGWAWLIVSTARRQITPPGA